MTRHDTTIVAERHTRILATLDRHAAEVRRHLPGGVLLADDRYCLLRRVASADGVTVAAVEAAIAWRRDLVTAVAQMPGRHPVTRGLE